MRETKFRGMDIKGNWYYGNLAILTRKVGHIDAGSYISNSIGLPFAYQVRPETVGEYAGKLDRNGKDIFEGDIVFNIETKDRGRVFWHDMHCMFCVDNSQTDIAPMDDWIFFEVIGNIYENPELLGDK